MKTKKLLTRQQAAKRAMGHLFDRVRSVRLQVHDDGASMPYRRGGQEEPCWCVRVPVEELLPGQELKLGPSWWILVSKSSGKILFSGWEGE